jgi:hypothetical protein
MFGFLLLVKILAGPFDASEVYFSLLLVLVLGLILHSHYISPGPMAGPLRLSPQQGLSTGVDEDAAASHRSSSCSEFCSLVTFIFLDKDSKHFTWPVLSPHPDTRENSSLPFLLQPSYFESHSG